MIAAKQPILNWTSRYQHLAVPMFAFNLLPPKLKFVTDSGSPAPPVSVRLKTGKSVSEDTETPQKLPAVSLHNGASV